MRKKRIFREAYTVQEIKQLLTPRAALRCRATEKQPENPSAPLSANPAVDPVEPSVGGAVAFGIEGHDVAVLVVVRPLEGEGGCLIADTSIPGCLRYYTRSSGRKGFPPFLPGPRGQTLHLPGIILRRF